MERSCSRRKLPVIFQASANRHNKSSTNGFGWYFQARTVHARLGKVKGSQHSRPANRAHPHPSIIPLRISHPRFGLVCKYPLIQSVQSYNSTFRTLFASPLASTTSPRRFSGRSFKASIIVSSVNQPKSSRKSNVSTTGTIPVVCLHLQDCFKSGPTWRVHELRAERGVFRCCNAAEEGEFVLQVEHEMVSFGLLDEGIRGNEERCRCTYLAQNVEAGDVGQQVEVGHCDDSLWLVQSDTV